jgi:hypothetical protein
MTTAPLLKVDFMRIAEDEVARFQRMTCGIRGFHILRLILRSMAGVHGVISVLANAIAEGEGCCGRARPAKFTSEAPYRGIRLSADFQPFIARICRGDVDHTAVP